jgi:hypothetical protein
MSENLLKLIFNLPKDWYAASTETVWVKPVQNNTAIVRNTPFYVKGVSFLDEVMYDIDGDQLVFKHVVRKSGHSTYRILQPNKRNMELFEKYWWPIQNLGCSYESKIDQNALYAVDVPPEANIKDIYKLLEKGEQDKIWSFEEADCARHENNIK